MDDELLSMGITDVSVADISEPEIESMDGGSQLVHIIIEQSSSFLSNRVTYRRIGW